MQISHAVSMAIERSKRVLFRPFEIGSWLAFGFVFFLAGLVDPIGGYNGRLRLPDFHRTPRGAPTTVTLPDIPELDQHRTAILAGIALAIVIGTAIGLALMWVGARGLMMSYRAASMGFVAIGESWRETAKPANALFRFFLLLWGIASVFGVPLLVLGAVRVIALYDSGERDAAEFLLAIAPHVLVLTLIGFAGTLVAFVARQFVAPFLLFLPGGCTVREAWSRFFLLARADLAGVVLFALARAVLAILIGVIGSAVASCTCCIGGLPVVHQTVLAPLLFFDRAFTLHALASLGPEYAVMAPELPPARPWQR